MRSSRTGAWLLLVSLWLSPPLWAWGAQGHRLVAAHAQARLQPAALAAVRELLAGEAEATLVGVSNWADDYREQPEGRASGPWHYVNFAPGSCQYRAAALCPEGNCLVAAIERQISTLRDQQAPREARTRALKFLVHFVADAHQPLHAGYFADRGGNRYQISYQREGWNLHSVWDSLLLRSGGQDDRGYLQAMQSASAETTELADAARWVEESCALVQAQGFYPPGHVISRSYLDAKRPLALSQLALAGERLAALLNALLASPPDTAAPRP